MYYFLRAPTLPTKIKGPCFRLNALIAWFHTSESPSTYFFCWVIQVFTIAIDWIIKKHLAIHSHFHWYILIWRGNIDPCGCRVHDFLSHCSTGSKLKRNNSCASRVCLTFNVGLTMEGSVSNVEVCNLAYTGQFEQLKECILSDKTLACKTDQVSVFLLACLK